MAAPPPPGTGPARAVGYPRPGAERHRAARVNGGWMSQLSDLLRAIELEEVGEHRFRAGSPPEAKGFIFGGQLIAQSIAAAVQGQPGKDVVTVHSTFARGGDPAVPLDIEVEHILNGRSFGSATVTLRQNGKVCTRSQLLLAAPDRDLINRYSDQYARYRALYPAIEEARK